MRISSNTIFDSNMAALNQQQARMLQAQQQIASGRRILTASDDPAAATRALEVSQSDATNTQYASNREAARSTLSLADGTLQSVTSLLQDVHDAAISAGDSLLSSSNRSAIALDLSGRLQELIGLANSTDGIGNYLFSGFQSKTQPFAAIAGGAVYSGDDGQHNIQVSAARQMASSNSGADVFMRVKSGNGTFVTQMDPASNAGLGNIGTGVISSGSVTNPAALVAGNSYSISFGLVAGVMNYTVTGAPVALAPPVTGVYVSGQAISFDGMQVDIQGTPAVTDKFTVTPSVNESIFKTISDLIGALNASTVVGANPANLTNSLQHSRNQLDNALNSVSATRATLGLRLNEIDSLQITGDSLGLQFKQTLSNLQDVDYTQAASDLVHQQTNLQAAYQSFSKVTGLSLFDYIR